jgi:hypothetical protein
MFQTSWQLHVALIETHEVYALSKQNSPIARNQFEMTMRHDLRTANPIPNVPTTYFYMSVLNTFISSNHNGASIKSRHPTNIIEIEVHTFIFAPIPLDQEICL